MKCSYNLQQQPPCDPVNNYMLKVGTANQRQGLMEHLPSLLSLKMNIFHAAISRKKKNITFVPQIEMNM